jgi:hypothetical protein
MEFVSPTRKDQWIVIQQILVSITAPRLRMTRMTPGMNLMIQVIALVLLLRY